MNHWCCCGALWVSLFVCVASSGAQTQPRYVLVLSSFEQRFSPHSVVAAVFRTELASPAPEPVQFIDVSLPSAFNNQDMRPEPTLDYLKTTFAVHEPDLIVSVGGVAALFAQRYRQHLFPETPLLFSSVDQRFVQNAHLTANEAAVAVSIDPSRLVDNILRVLPLTTTVAVVIGSSQIEDAWREALSRAFEPFKDRLNFIWFNHLSFQEMLKRSASLPPHSAILFAHLAIDAHGAPQVEEHALPQLHGVANAPIFGVYNSQLGRGIVGGPVLAIDELGRKTADVARRILRGESPGNLTPPPQLLSAPTFDAAELERWHISESKLPEGSVVLFRQPSIWQRYSAEIISAIVIGLVETTLVVALLTMSVKRRRAERLVQESEERFRVLATALSNLSQKLMQAQEKERTWIARELHDDVCQRVAGLTMQLDTLRQRLPDDGAALRDALADLLRQCEELGSDIQALSHRLHSSKLELLGLPRAAAAFCKELSEQHGLTIDFTHEGVSQSLAPEIKLGLFRVMQEALMNAVRHSGVRQFDVALRGNADSIHLDVIDHGVGFHPEDAVRGAGLGLVSMRERLSLIGGELVVHSRPGEGTSVHVRVPSAAVQAGSLSSPGEFDANPPRGAGAASDGGRR